MGRASAVLLSQRGYIVYAATRTPESLHDIAGDTLIPLALDITDMHSITEALHAIDPIDILINNAGYGLVATVEEVREEEMLAQFNVNVFGLLRVTKTLIPHMRRQRSGIIINISSFLGRIGLPLFTLYNASKYAVEGITDSLRYELSPFNIRVHSIMPGFFDTNFARDNLVTNADTFSQHSPYANLVATLAPVIVEQINGGNAADEVAKMILNIIADEQFEAHATVGDKAKKFIPMRKELSDEDFERRVREYYQL